MLGTQGGRVALLRTYLLPERGRLLLLTLLLFGTIGLQLANPQILRAFIDNALSGASLHTLTLQAILFLAVAVLTQVVSVAETYAAEDLGWVTTNRLRADLALHCLRLDPSFYNEYTPGALIERVDGDVTTLSNFFSRFVVYLAGNGILLVAVIVLLFRIDWRVGSVTLLTTGIGLPLLRYLAGLAVPFWSQERQASSELFGFIEERLAGTEDIRSSGAGTYTMQGLYGLLRRRFRAAVFGNMLGASYGGGATMILTVTTALTVGIGAYLYLQGRATAGTIFVIFSYTQMLDRPIELMLRQLQQVQQATAGARRIAQILAIRSRIEPGTLSELPRGPLSVQFDHVTFSYGDGDPVLRDVSFEVRPGSVLGLLGRTGSGKTTISRLLFRLYDVQGGSIALGGTDVRSLTLDTLRSRVGMVTQEIQLFHATVRDNLTLFDDTVPAARIEEVLAGLGMLEWVRSLPQGIDTVLTGGSGGLSAGEAQLLAFARVFLKDPSVVILDEASSRLDPATERRIEQAVDRLLAGRTGIIIAHRLATVTRADEILILDDGEVVEMGGREELASAPDSRFAAMLRAGMEEVLV